MSFELTFRRKVVTLSAILGVLAVTWVLGLVFSPENVRQRAAREPLTPILNKESVREISLASPQGNVELKKTGDDWTVLIQGVSFPAQETRIDSFLDLVAGLKKSRVVATGEANWSAFEVDGKNAKRLQLKDGAGKSLLDLHVGKVDVGSRGSFVRVEGAGEVVQVDRSLESYAIAGTEFWSDLRLFPKDLQGKALIRIGIRSRVRFDADGKQVDRPIQATLFLDSAQNGPVWKLEGATGAGPDTGKVEQLADALAGFEGTQFVADLAPDQAGFDQPLAEILMTTDKDVQYRLLIGRPDPQQADQYHVRLDGQTYSYLAPAWRIQQVLQGPEALSAAK